jgi:UDPglucose--hexose-1-phosphate uridylyltransferase
MLAATAAADGSGVVRSRPMSRRPRRRQGGHGSVVPLPPPAPPHAPGELRQDPLGGGWVAITAGRAARPEAFLADEGPVRGPLGCPFCRGNEHLTPPEVWADREPGSGPDRPGWRVRVVPNKFPAFAGPPRSTGAPPWGSPDPSAASPQRNGGLYRTAPTAGVHEVVVHNPDHVATLADLPEPAVARVVAAWRARLAAHADRRFGAVIVIVNQGRTAGASLEHPHSQVFATADRPERVAAELDRLAGDGCAACAMVAAERDGQRVVERAAGLLTVCPWASSVPFEALLLPERHQARLQEDGDAAIAAALRGVLGRLRGAAGASAAPYNLVLHTAPPGVDDFHWHLHLLPRLTTFGGFELGTGIVINVVDPDHAAAALRGAPG